MLKPTRVGSFGRTRVHLVVPDGSGAFEKIRSKFEDSEVETDLGASVVSSSGRVQIGIVAASVPPRTRDRAVSDAQNLIWIEVFISDYGIEGAPTLPPHPDRGPRGGEIREVDYSRLLDAILEALPGKHALHYRSSITVDTATTLSEFPLPVSFWRSKRPFGDLIGARFELRRRGLHDGWIGLEWSETEISANMAFVRDTEFGEDVAERVWNQFRRIYDELLIPTATIEEGGE